MRSALRATGPRTLTPAKLVAGLAVVALTVAACGSSDPAASTSTPATSAAPTSPAGASSAEPTSAESSTGDAASSEPAESSAPAGGDPKTATSVADFGGMEGLVAAANAEGALNVIALPPDWANYGEIIALFQSKYPEITIDQQQPNSSSAQEIAAADATKGTDKAPDVFDLGPSVANENVDLFAPYKVATWDQIPDDLKDPDGRWVNDYTGIMAVGYNADKYGDVTTLDQLKDPKFSGAIALNGNPTESGAAFNGVVMAALGNGGSADDIQPGIDWFGELKDLGNFLPIDPTPATIMSGQTGVVIDWSYNQAAVITKLADEGTTWKTFVPEGATVGSYYVQAINADAPHPAAARLWQEFLYTPEAQNLWIKGGAKPVLYDAMVADGTIDPAVEGNLPPTEGGITTLDETQTAAANELLKTEWTAAVGG